MHASQFSPIYDHVRAIYRALTGQELTLPEAPGERAGEAPPPEVVTRRFAEMDALVRAIPGLAERVPPFSFTPPVDLYTTERELVIELGVPGVDRQDVTVERNGDFIVIAGARTGGPRPDDRNYFHAELPRGPFYRALPLPQPTVGDPRIEVDNGLIRVRVTRASKTTPAKA